LHNEKLWTLSEFAGADEQRVATLRDDPATVESDHPSPRRHCQNSASRYLFGLVDQRIASVVPPPIRLAEEPT